METTAHRIETDRTLIRPAEPADAAAIAAYYQENRAYLKPFEPIRPEAFFTAGFWATRAETDREAREGDRAYRFFVFERAEPARVIGSINIDGVVRGAAQYAHIGYSLAEHCQGQGLMREALAALLPYAFEHLQLHRIQANYMPTNERSGNLLRRLGFVVEGYARDYLLLNGAWRDHVLTSLTNPAWQPPGT